jgi:hypothetical protein
MNDKERTFMCIGKHGFLTRPEADRCANKIRRRSNVTITSFKCTICNKWHIGSWVKGSKAASKTRKKEKNYGIYQR